MNMKKLKKDQRGLTLVELLIAILLTGLITGGITMTIFQVFNLNTRTSNRMTAVRQVQHAGFWVSPDVQMALEVDTENDPGTPEFELLTLTWNEGGTGIPHEVIYTLEDGELWRNESINGGNSTLLTRVAEYISDNPADTYCDWDDENKKLTFRVTANVGGQIETREYKVKPRPESS